MLQRKNTSKSADAIKLNHYLSVTKEMEKKGLVARQAPTAGKSHVSEPVSQIEKGRYVVDITLSCSPDQTIFECIDLRMLIHFCGPRRLRHYIFDRMNDTTVLILPAAHCEIQGLYVVLTWMIQAYQQGSHNFLPDDLPYWKHPSLLPVLC